MKKFKSLAENLNQVVKKYGLEEYILEGDIINKWNEIVGPKVARNTQVKRIENGVLVVKVKNDVWRNELTFYKIDLIKKINEMLGNQMIKDIRWI
ncbi:DUF721 domain-containing protein [candidate division KSB1 bacterium]|nr:DUF721 domain-containing protein [candidate division KSB1 bacterium]